LRIADALIKKIRKQFPSAAIDTLDVFAEKLPEMNITRVKGKYMLMSGQELSGDAVAAWEEIKAHIARFLAADIIIISTPMWNFGIPYRLKHYIDVVWQPGFMFKYTENGPVGLAAGRKVFAVSTRGGDYSAGTPAEPYDQITPYLKTVLGWAGITDLTFISGQPMDANTEDGREAKIKEAIARIDSLNLA
ncbi:MAG TPA: NAD(P)H-dependent oxidoreductase, partial [Candidatus Rifleibacterium sp.]|nr:NAD(P)H-dependent oxidoreductase [Candidatus Rifleibacterium sp.]